MIRLGHISSLTGIGRRNNNEDSFRIGENGVFVVCDGVGGVEKGEVASEIVADTFLSVYKEHPAAEPDFVLREAEKALSAHIEANRDSMGMATTLTFSQVRPEGILVAWVGDSRVYQFRKGSILYVTKDHSWVNEAVDSGILTPDEAIGHPKSNVITRAVQGLLKPTRADQVLLSDLMTGDCILHCSDGVLEAWDDNDLSALFNSNDDLDEIVNQLKSYCENESKDNYTAIVYRIDDVSIQKLSHSSPPEEMVDKKVPQVLEYGNVSQSGTSAGGGLERKIPILPVIFLVSFLVLSIGIYSLKSRFFKETKVTSDSLELQHDKSYKNQRVSGQTDTSFKSLDASRRDSVDSGIKKKNVHDSLKNNSDTMKSLHRNTITEEGQRSRLVP